MQQTTKRVENATVCPTGTRPACGLVVEELRVHTASRQWEEAMTRADRKQANIRNEWRGGADCVWRGSRVTGSTSSMGVTRETQEKMHGQETFH